MVKKNCPRIIRIEGLIQEALAKLIQTEVKDQRIGMVTITGVQVSRDLSFAKVYVVTHENEADKIKIALQALNHAAKFLRCRLSEEVQLRKMPVLRFYYDDVWQQGFHLSQLLQEDSIKE